MKYAECDNCGAKDDASYGKGPILVAGLVIQVRKEDGDGISVELEVCEKCREAILEAFPDLWKAINKTTT